MVQLFPIVLLLCICFSGDVKVYVNKTKIWLIDDLM